jgi:RecB family exonuclease
MRQEDLVTETKTAAGFAVEPSVTPIPPTFSFSQSSLQAFEDCPRRFWLAYIEQLPWPAVEASPIQEHEELMRLGERFHRLVQRAEIGIDPDIVAAGLEPPLSTWFTAYLTYRPADLPEEFVEIERVLSIAIGAKGKGREAALVNERIGGGGRGEDIVTESGNLRIAQSPISNLQFHYRLAAKYDLIAAQQDGRVVIVDWKTAKRRADPATLRQRWQSVVYPYVLVEASANLPWGPMRPEQVEMRYWFTAAPGQPVVFRYDSAQHAANHERLQQLLGEILAGETEADFPKVPDTELNRKRFCSYCIYRSRCNRGIAAGDLEALSDTEDFFAVDVASALEFTLAEVDELAF